MKIYLAVVLLLAVFYEVHSHKTSWGKCPKLPAMVNLNGTGKLDVDDVSDFVPNLLKDIHN